MRFEGKVLFTTGAGSGLAEAVSRRFSADGGRVAVLDLDGAKAEAVAADLEGSIAIQLDAADEDSVAAAVATTVAELGRIDCVFNAAGHADFGPIEEWSLERWNRMLGVHAGGTFLSCKHTLPHLRAAGGGAIVNVASIAAITAQPFNAPYGAAKAAIVGFTRQLSRDVAPDNIRVNAVAPGRIKTGMTTPLYTERGGGDFEKGAALAIPGIPMGRIGEPREIAEPVCFLLSERGELHHRPGDRARRRRDLDMRRVTVVGAGAAGLCAAFAAAKSGAQVTVLESGDRIGGTTALSGGNGWFPGNRHVPDDSPGARPRLPPGALARRRRRRRPPGVRARGRPVRRADRARDAGVLAVDPVLRLPRRVRGRARAGRPHPRAAPDRPHAPRRRARARRAERDRAGHLHRSSPPARSTARRSPGARSAGRSRSAAHSLPACSRRASTRASRSRPGRACRRSRTPTPSYSRREDSSGIHSSQVRSCAARCWHRSVPRLRAVTASGSRSRRAPSSAR